MEGESTAFSFLNPILANVSHWRPLQMVEQSFMAVNSESRGPDWVWKEEED
jgi:hypothetical protein